MTSQSKLGAIQDKIKTKLLDNIIRLSGSSVDMIRVRMNLDKFGDTQSRIVEKYDLIDVLLPAMTDVPLRRVEDYTSGNISKINVNFASEGKMPILNVLIPVKFDIWQGDLLIKLYDGSGSTGVYSPYILVLEVKEVFGNFGERSVVMKSFKTTFYDEALPDALLQKIIQMVDRRNLF